MDEREIKEEYKRVFDNIRASDELRNRIILQKKPPKRNFMPIIATVSSIAAAVVMFAAVKDYDFKTDGSGVISESVSETTSAPVEYALQKTEQYTAEPTENPYQYREPVKQPAPTARPAPKRSVSVSDTVSVVSPPTEAPVEVVTEAPTAVVTEMPTTEPQALAGGVKVRLGYKGVLLNINSPSIMPKDYAAAAAELYTADESEYTVEEWDNDRYFNYIGTDIINGVEYSGDLIYTGGASSSFTVDSNGLPLNDTRIFTFSGNNGRFAQIVTSRDLTYANAVISDDGIVLSDINGTNAAVFAQDSEYSIYMIYNGTSYIINASELTEEEVCIILATLVD